MSLLSDMLTRRSLTVAASATGEIPPMPGRSRERLWRRDVDLACVPPGSVEKTAIANANSKKPVFQGAAVASNGKADAAKDRAKTSSAKPVDTGHPAVEAGLKSDSSKKSR